MIDTVKFKIPYSKDLVQDIYRKGVNVNVNFDSGTRTTNYSYFRGYKPLGSYNRNVNLFINTQLETLFLELSLPKFVFGHNVFMLYPEEVEMVIYKLWSALNRTYDTRFPDPVEWEIYRLDLCYNWKLPTQESAVAMLNCIKAFKFPYKTKNKYKTGVFFKGGRMHTIKFYLKQPEFFKHDFKALKKDQRTIDKAYRFYDWSAGVLRFEVTLKRRYLLDKFPDYLLSSHVATRRDILLPILREFLSSSLANEVSEFMTIEETRKRLDDVYSKRTANYLMEYWLILQHYDHSEVESILGISKSNIYRRNSQLKKAKVGTLLPGGVEEFVLEVPSEYSTNDALIHEPKRR